MWGLWALRPQSRERDNSMRGMTSHLSYYSPHDNCVYAGRTAIAVANAESTGQPYKPSIGGTVYTVVPHGLPTTQEEVVRLRKYVNDTYNPREARIEGHILLRELYYIAFSTLPEHRDDAMTLLLGLDDYSPEAYPDGFQESHIQALESIPRFIRGSSGLSVKLGTATARGLAPPTGAKLLDIDLVGQYLLAHCHPDAPDGVDGVLFEQRRVIHRRTIFGYGLARIFGPQGELTSQKLVRPFALLFATPGWYQEFIDSYNGRNPSTPFQPQSGPTYRIRPLATNYLGPPDPTVADAARILILNGIPKSWVDHAYLFGLWWLNHSHLGETEHSNLYDAYDDRRLEYLARNGIPPAIPEWDGWRYPSIDDLNRYWHQEQINAHRPQPSSFANRGWLSAGGDAIIRLLTHRYYASPPTLVPDLDMPIYEANPCGDRMACGM